MISWGPLMIIPAILLLLDLSSAFDTVDHSILLTRLEHRFGIKYTALNWFRSYLTNRKQCVSIRKSTSSCRNLEFGVLQGSVLGPILYVLYTTSLGDILREHGVRYHPAVRWWHTDVSIFKSTSLEHIDRSVETIHSCVNDISKWITANKLKLNKDKTALIVISSQHRPRLQLDTLIFGSDSVFRTNAARNIGVTMNDKINFEKQVASICKSSFYHLRNIARIRRFLSEESTKALVHAFVTCRLDNCNSLIYGLPKNQIEKLQRVQNCAVV